MYPFVSHTWNPIKGKCPYDCGYCYMKKWGLAAPHELRDNELKTNLGQDRVIFIGSSTDIWHPTVENGWIAAIRDHCKKYDNSYLFQSKNPERFLKWDFPQKTILATTIETNRAGLTQMFSAPTSPFGRARALSSVKNVQKMVSIEPIMDFCVNELEGLVSMIEPQLVTIGADSQGHGLPEPKPERILNLVYQLAKFTKVLLKDNLGRIIGKDKVLELNKPIAQKDLFL